MACGARSRCPCRYIAAALPALADFRGLFGVAFPQGEAECLEGVDRKSRYISLPNLGASRASGLEKSPLSRQFFAK